MFKKVNKVALSIIPTYQELYDHELLKRSMSDFERREWSRARGNLRWSKFDAFMGVITLIVGFLSLALAYASIGERGDFIKFKLVVTLIFAAGCIIIGIIDIIVAGYESRRAFEIKQGIIQWRYGAHIAQRMVGESPSMKCKKVTFPIWVKALIQVLFNNNSPKAGATATVVAKN